MTTEVTSVTITHFWDDETTTTYNVNYIPGLVELQCSGHTINFYLDSWPSVREQIEGMMDLVVVREGCES